MLVPRCQEKECFSHAFLWNCIIIDSVHHLAVTKLPHCSKVAKATGTCINHQTISISMAIFFLSFFFLLFFSYANVIAHLKTATAASRFNGPKAKGEMKIIIMCNFSTHTQQQSIRYTLHIKTHRTNLPECDNCNKSQKPQKEEKREKSGNRVARMSTNKFSVQFICVSSGSSFF